MNKTIPIGISKLSNSKTTIFTTIGNLARSHNAIDLSQGFPNFKADTKLMNMVTAEMRKGYNQYAPMRGDKELREVIATKIQSLHGHNYNAENEVLITVGATQALYSAITALVHPGDEVVVIKPAYDCYEPAIELAGGKIIPYQLNAPDYKIDWEVFKSCITPKTKLVLLNTPHNPTGTVCSKTDMLALQKILKPTSIFLLCDEVYEHIIFDGHEHQSASRFPDLVNRSIVCASFGKTFHVTGWKIGYCVAPANIMDEIIKVHQWCVFSVDHPTQRAIAKYLQEPETYLGLQGFYQEKRDYFLDLIKGSKFSFTPSKGTYFQLLNYTNITEERDADFAKRLITEHGLASIPISSFNTKNRNDFVLRFCFAKTNETLEKAAEILNRL